MNTSHTGEHSIYHRAHPATGVQTNLGKPTTVFVTVCTKDRVRWLACNEAHNLLTSIWKNSTAWLVGSYVLMPDHLHLFASPHDLHFTIEQWIKYWKSQFSKSHTHLHWQWQTSAFHHRLRDDENHSEKWLYIQQNPVRAGLVKQIGDWRYQGTLHPLSR